MLTTFIVAQAMVSPVIDWLTARLGRKQLMLTCIGMFTTCAYQCASADSISETIIYRTGQGLCGAPLVALWPSFVRVVLDMPMDTAGMVLANRGIGLFPAMLFGSWFVNRYAPRILMVESGQLI